MAARAGMANLILRLRSMCSAGTADYTVNGTAYWTDDQMQNYLDRYRSTLKRLPLEAEEDYSNGAYTFTDYPIPAHLGNFEESGVSSGWALRDSAGVSAPSYTVDYNAGRITFAADTTGITYYLDCRVYDLNRAAADVWEEKAAVVASNVNWQSDNHRIDAGSEYEHCIKMAAKFRSAAGVSTARFVRSDEVVRTDLWP